MLDLPDFDVDEITFVESTFEHPETRNSVKSFFMDSVSHSGR